MLVSTGTQRGTGLALFKKKKRIRLTNREEEASTMQRARLEGAPTKRGLKDRTPAG